MKAYRIHLIRHGRTNAGDEVYYNGTTDIGLTDEGVEELLDAKRENMYPFAERFYCSPLIRCRKTLETIYPDEEYQIIDGIRECDFGDFEGKPSSQLQNNEDYHRWLKGAPPPNGEGTKEFTRRSVVAFAQIVEDIMRSGVRSSVVCTHGGTIMAILSVCGLPQAPFSEWICDYGCGYTLLVTPSMWMRGYKAEVIDRI